MLSASGWAVHLLAWGWISDDSEGNLAAPQLFADLKISGTAVMNQGSEHCIEQSWDQKPLQSQSACKNK